MQAARPDQGCAHAHMRGSPRPITPDFLSASFSCGNPWEIMRLGRALVGRLACLLLSCHSVLEHHVSPVEGRILPGAQCCGPVIQMLLTASNSGPGQPPCSPLIVGTSFKQA